MSNAPTSIRAFGIYLPILGRLLAGASAHGTRFRIRNEFFSSDRGGEARVGDPRARPVLRRGLPAS